GPRPPIPLENGLFREIEPLEYRHRFRFLRHLPAGHVFGVVGKSSSCRHDDTLERLGRYNAVIIETVSARVSPHKRSHYFIVERAFALLLFAVPLEPPGDQLPAGCRLVGPVPTTAIVVRFPRVRDRLSRRVEHIPVSGARLNGGRDGIPTDSHRGGAGCCRFHIDQPCPPSIFGGRVGNVSERWGRRLIFFFCHRRSEPEFDFRRKLAISVVFAHRDRLIALGNVGGRENTFPPFTAAVILPIFHGVAGREPVPIIGEVIPFPDFGAGVFWERRPNVPTAYSERFAGRDR